MKRRWFLVLGVLTVASQVGPLVAFGIPSSPPASTVLTVVSTVLAGVLFVLGGLAPRIGGVEWYRFVGIAALLAGIGFALAMVVPILNGTSAYEREVRPLLAVAATIGGASLAFIGIDWLRGGRHFDLSIYEPGPILGSASDDRSRP